MQRRSLNQDRSLGTMELKALLSTNAGRLWHINRLIAQGTEAHPRSHRIISCYDRDNLKAVAMRILLDIEFSKTRTMYELDGC